MDGTKSSDYESLKKVVLIIIWNLIKLDATDCTCTDLRECGLFVGSGIFRCTGQELMEYLSTDIYDGGKRHHVSEKEDLQPCKRM